MPVSDVISVGVLALVLLVEGLRARRDRPIPQLSDLDAEFGPIVRRALDEDAARLLLGAEEGSGR